MLVKLTTSNQKKFLSEDFLLSLIVSIILHIVVVCMFFFQYKAEKKPTTHYHITAKLMTTTDVNKLLNKKNSNNTKISDMPNTKTSNKSTTIANKNKVVKVAKNNNKAKADGKNKQSNKDTQKQTDVTQQPHDKILQNKDINEIVEQYAYSIQQEITNNWEKPYVFNISNPVVVQIKINNQGYITDISLLTSSYNKVYDASILQAIKDSSPLKTVKKMDTKTFTNNFTKIKLFFKPEDLN